jgi:hypothetical protein
MSIRLVNIEQYHEDQSVAKRIASSKEEAAKAQWLHYFDGIPMEKELVEFACELRQAMPNLTFLPIDWTRVGYNNTTVMIFNELSVCMDGYPFDIGRINYSDNAVKRGGGDKTLSVYSRKIHNAKYAVHRNQYHMIMSSDIKKAVKNACKYFVPYSTKDLAQAYYSPMKQNVEKSYTQARSKLNNHLAPLGSNYNIYAEELLNLKAQGVKFKTQTFREVAEGLEEVYTAYATEKNRKIDGMFVRTYMVGDVPHVSLYPVKNIKDTHDWKDLPQAETTDKPLAELDQEYVGSVSVLSILTNNQYVDNVGMKMDGNHFWIQKDGV